MKPALNLEFSEDQEAIQAAIDIAGENDNVVSTDKLTDLIIENFEQVCNEEAIGVFTL